MRKSILLLSLSFLLGLTSCFKEENDVFDESSALRLNHTIESYQELLTSAENGWVLQYFATENGIAGVPMLVDFQKTGAVVVGAQNKIATNDTYKEETSAFDIIGDYGPVLTFNTYNTLLHVYSNPEDLPSTSDEDEQGVGYGGDYEFRIVSVSEDQNTVYMKGKKTDMDVVLTRLSTDLAWSDYYSTLRDVKNTVIPLKMTVAYLKAGEHMYTVTGFSTGILSFVPFGGDAVSQTTKRSCISYVDGSLHLSTPYTGDDGEISVQNFVLGDNGLLVCTDENAEAILTSEPLSTFFTDVNNKWRIDRTSYDAALLDLDSKLNEAMVNDGYGKLSYVQFTYNASQNVMQLAIKSQKIETYCYFKFEITADNGVSLSLDLDAMRASTVRQVKNAVVVYDTTPAFKAFVDSFNGSYTLEGNSKLATTELTLSGTHSLKVNMQ